jgi:predicted amidohydrolase
VQANIHRYLTFIERAASMGADAIFFPELSLTGYEPKLDKELATSVQDKRFDVFQAISDRQNIAIGIGIPIARAEGVAIGMLIVQPGKPRQSYSKQFLHSDEVPYFVGGVQGKVLDLHGHKVALAICYESLLSEHSDEAVKNGADIYLASVAKSARGVEKAFSHYQQIAQRHRIIVLMANSIGPSDDFVGAGRSAVWNRQGTLMAQLDAMNEGHAEHEGLLIYDTVSGEIVTLIDSAISDAKY